MTDEECEALRRTLIAFGVVVPLYRAATEEGQERWAGCGPDDCSCTHADDCPNGLVCKRYPQHRRAAVEQYLKEK